MRCLELRDGFRVNVLGLMLRKIAQEQKLTLQDTKPIPVNSPQYPANGIEFIAKDPNSNGQLKGRIYLVGDPKGRRKPNRL